MNRVRHLGWILPLLAINSVGCAGADSVDSSDADPSDSALGVERGVDYAWSRPSPKGLKSDGYGFVARYLSFDTTGKTLSKGEADELIKAGLDIVCDWEESADAALDGFSRGRSDAEAAAKEASEVGMPKDRPIYFSIDFDAQPSQEGVINDYYDGVASVIGRDRTGAYGGYYLIERLFAAKKIAWGWQTYAWSEGHWDGRAQLRQFENDVTVAGGSTDLDVAMTKDFGQWGHAAPATPKKQHIGSRVVDDADGRLEAFYFTSSGSLAHVWQTAKNGTWSKFGNLGGSGIGAPAVIANEDGRLEAFVTHKNGQLFHIWQEKAGGSWSDWSRLSNIDSATTGPAVAENEDGRLEVFVTTSSGAVHHAWQKTKGGSFSDFSNLGGKTSMAPVVAADEDGRLEVFVTTSSGAVDHAWQKTKGGAWSDFASLGGSARTIPAIGVNEDGRLELFVTTKSNAVEHVWQKTKNGAWSDWANLGGSNQSAVSIGTNKDGRLEAFVEGSKGAVWHAWQKTAGGAWSDWSKLGGAGAPTAGHDADGRLEVFGESDGKISHAWQEPSGGWSDWASLGTP